MNPDDITHLYHQLKTAQDNLRLIEERKSEYVLSTDIPLQLIKEEALIKSQIDALTRQILALEEYKPSDIHVGDVALKNREDIDKRQLRTYLIDKFDEEELAILCADVEHALHADNIHVSVDLEIVGGKSKTSKVLNLIQFLDRRGLLGYLVRIVRESRPGLP
jgi:hypothetical protein